MLDGNELNGNSGIRPGICHLTLVAKGLICDSLRNLANVGFIRIFMPGISQTVAGAWNY